MDNAWRVPPLIAVAAFLTLAGCGGDGTSEPTAASPQRKAAERAEAEAPEGASPVLRAIYRQFPAPRANPRVQGSAGAIAAGERACAGKTPLEVREEFLPRSDLDGFQREQAERIPGYERNPSYSFPAGQLAASVYEKSLPPTEVAPYGFLGCVYALSEVLKAQFAPR